MTRSAHPATVPTLGEVVDLIEELYPLRWADDGDAVGLVVGRPEDSVSRVLYAVDPVQAVVEEAVSLGADLLVVHHPLFYRAVHTVAADTPKGRVVHDLIGHGIGLYVAHTNADSPRHGVSQAMAEAFGLEGIRPLMSSPGDPFDKIVTFVPLDDVVPVIDALAAAGAGAIGDYDRCAFVSTGEGTFRPGPGSQPAIGERGEIVHVEEKRVEMVLPRAARSRVVAALRAAHPYEEPAFDVLELAAWADNRGHGRLGELPTPMSLREFADVVVNALPETAVGARLSGDLDEQLQTVALSGGAGDFLLDAVRASGADVYVTSDLRHHPASEFREHGGTALIDVPHWAAEWSWLPVVQRVIAAGLAGKGYETSSTVSRICTDPWNQRASRQRDR